MNKAKLLSADFEQSTMEFAIEDEFIAKKGEYRIMDKEEFESLSDMANGNYAKEISGNPKDFERDLFHVINAYCKKGLKKPDLLHKMQYVTKSCEIS